MADRPILFSGPMVRALLEGRKTQTRRVLKPQPPTGAELVGLYAPGLTAVFEVLTQRGPDHTVRLPYMPGDRLWVREAHHRTNDSPESHLVGYDFADGPVPREFMHHIPGVGDVQFFRHSLGGWGGRASRNYPAMHMPRWASRLTLEVTDVRVQRVQEIDEADARAEGLATVTKDGRLWKWGIPDRDGLPGNDDYGWHWAEWRVEARDAFRSLWDGLNAKRGFGWKKNPWVVAVGFTVAQGNIDQLQ